MTNFEKFLRWMLKQIVNFAKASWKNPLSALLFTVGASVLIVNILPFDGLRVAFWGFATAAMQYLVILCVIVGGFRYLTKSEKKH